MEQSVHMPLIMLVQSEVKNSEENILGAKLCDCRTTDRVWAVYGYTI